MKRGGPYVEGSVGEASGMHAGGAPLGSPCPLLATHPAPPCPPPPLVAAKPWLAGAPGPPLAQPPGGSQGQRQEVWGSLVAVSGGGARGESYEIVGFLVCLDAKISSWRVRGRRAQGFSAQAARKPRCPAKTVPKVSEPPR